MANCLTFKKSNCKNCYKCIRHCPVKSIRFSGNQAHIIGNECILCGQCFVVCPQDAKQIVDDTEKVRVLIQSGAPVYVSLAPSFIANYAGVGIGGMRRALQKLGFADVEETALGASIVKTEYERMLAEGTRDIIISSCCHSVNLLIQKHFPAELPYLADVLSPMQAHCAEIKKRHPDAKTVFIGCELGGHILPEGWHNWDKKYAEKTVFYAEAASVGEGARPSGRVAWSRQLKDSELGDYVPEKVLDAGAEIDKNGNIVPTEWFFKEIF